jgi:drug/metabolite transporter (DMT)-like permease
MPGLLAALASLLWGTSDFFGGLAAKGWPVQRVGVVVQTVSLAIVAAILVVVPADPRAADLGWGAIAGVATAAGIALLYRGLAIGPMHVVAPTTAVVGASVNVAVGLVSGERPTVITSAGVALAILAVGLVGWSAPRVDQGGRPSRRVIQMAIGAGICLGVLNVCFAATEAASGVWPVGVSRLVALILLGASAAVARPSAPSTTGSAPWWAVGAGVADIGATMSIALALQRGSLVVVSVLGALFPAVTVVLARAFLAERMARLQLAGLVAAIAAVILMASGSITP